MNRKLAKNVCLVFFVLTMFLFFECAFKELKWAIVSVSDQNKFDWAASQSAANTSDVYSISSLIFLIVALVFLVGWLYYRENEKA